MRISDWSSDVCSSDLVSALGCEIKEEVSAEGRYRGTFASKGTHPQLPAVCRRRAFFEWIEEEPLEGVVAMAFHRRLAEAQDAAVAEHTERDRAEERSVGKECGSTCRSRWST